MSLLMPLFLAGLATLALPVLLHLVRRTPRGRFDFSSLMFLDPVPPQLTRRSRLEHWLLLALRLGALALLTLAFARPFLREAAPLALANLPARRVALLLDTSASLQRPGLWDHVLAASRRELDQLGPQDRVGLYTFGDTLETVVEVDAELTPEEQRAAVASALAGLKPGWQGTDLGLALVGVADRLVAGADRQAAESAGVIVLISDLAKGSRLEALDRAPWPQGVSVVLRPPTEPPRGNAQLQLLANPAGDDSPGWRVRVTNSAESTESEWRLTWQSRGVPADANLPADTSLPGETTVTVPPGESRVLRIDPGTQSPGTAQLTLKNDPVAFDNEWYLAPPPRKVACVLIDGGEEDRGTAGLPYYLRLAGAAEEHREVLIEPYSSARLTASDPAPVSMVVLTGDEPVDPVSGERDTAALLAWVEQGGTAWAAASGAEPPRWLASLFPELIAHSGLREPESGFALLADLDFTHPWLAPFATPPHGDFTGIHFWKTCQWEVRPTEELAPGSARQRSETPAPGKTATAPPPAVTATSPQEQANASATGDTDVASRGGAAAAGGRAVTSSLRVLARFDNGDPALVERRFGAGRLFALAGSWRPADSQLALSGKFVVLMSRLLDLAAGATDDAVGLRVGQPWPIPARLRSVAGEVVTPDGQNLPLREGQATFAETETPGLYTARLGGEEFVFAVNLDPAEGQTSPLDPDLLARRGVTLNAGQTAAARLERMRQERDTELEGRQKLWRWLLLAALLLLVAETIASLHCESPLTQPGTAP